MIGVSKSEVHRHPAQILFVGIALVLLQALAYGQPTSPQLELSTQQTTFHIGETIPLTLSLTGPDNKQFHVNTASYDRSGRMNLETFNLSPSAGWADPLADLFRGIGGGMSGIGTLSSSPTIIPINLNEWVRFDQPGVYHLTVTSSRVAAINAPFNSSPMALTSNPIELHIIPTTPEFQRTRLVSILARLEGPPPLLSTPSPDRTSAIADLRFLGSHAAIEVMADNLRDDRAELSDQCSLGLIGLPDSTRSIALDALNRRLDEPHFPVSSQFLSTLANIQVDHSPQHQDNQLNHLYATAWQATLQSVARKQNNARALTLHTLVSFIPAEINPQTKAQLDALLSTSFTDLPEDRQTMELNNNWDALRSPAILSTLRTLATKPHIDPESQQPISDTQRDLEAAVLRRWYELDPDGAYRQILIEIGSASPSLSARSLFFLPPQTLPQYESIWAEEFIATVDSSKQARLGGLLVRFGTGAAASQLVGEANKHIGDWSCQTQAIVLAYLVKFSPDVARLLLQRAREARGPGQTECYHSLFQEISAYTYGPPLMEAAVASLDDTDRRLASDAINYLTSYGDKTIQQPIWGRYQKWSEQWSGRADLLESNQPAAAEHWLDVALGQDLARALLANQGWLADKDLIVRVRQLSIGKRMSQEIDQITQSAQPPYYIGLDRSEYGSSYRIAEYEAKSMELFESKIKQFPRGTTFRLQSQSHGNSDQKALEDEVASLFKKHGMTLQIQ